jgi:hypothetical protein
MSEQAESASRAGSLPGRPTAERPAERPAGRRTLPAAAGFWVLAVAFMMLFFASAAASPLYGVYQARFNFSTTTLTAVFAVYVRPLSWPGRGTSGRDRARRPDRGGARAAGPAPAVRVDLPPGPCTVPPCLPDEVAATVRR